jgi:hypothetical protein
MYALSNIGQLKAGVPQGSVLDPLLFLVFINNIADGMTGLGRLFADDTSIGHFFKIVSFKFKFKFS